MLLEWRHNLEQPSRFRSIIAFIVHACNFPVLDHPWRVCVYHSVHFKTNCIVFQTFGIFKVGKFQSLTLKWIKPCFIHATLPLIFSIFVNSQKKLDLKASASLKKACLHVRLTVQFVMKCNFENKTFGSGIFILNNQWRKYQQA
jgi:hypothetical protein